MLTVTQDCKNIHKIVTLDETLQKRDDFMDFVNQAWFVFF